MINFLKKLHADESGATAIEYGLIAALIAIGIIAALSMTGNSLSAGMGAAGDGLNSAEINVNGPYGG